MSMDLVIAILYSLAVLSILIFFYYILGYRNQKKEWNQRVKQWYPEEKRKSFLSKWGERFDELEYAKSLEGKLHSANVKLLPSEYLATLVVGALTIFILFYSIFHMPLWVSMMLAIIITSIIHFLLFYIRKNNYEKRFNEQLGEVCRLLGNAARSGLTINQGIDIVAREMNDAAGTEFKRISYELKMGVPLEAALKTAQKKNDSRDFNLFIATILIQKKTGGNLAKTLDTMAATFEDRKVLDQTIKTMTAEEKYISYLVPILPIFLLLVMNNVIDGFINPLWTNPFGIVLLVIFICAILLSIIIIRKITNIKV